MAAAAGILTASGGLASHAAVVARGWGIPAVVGATGLEVGPSGIGLGERQMSLGETITIDGGSGAVFAGAVSGATVVVPEAATLRAWARELGIPIGDEPNSPATVATEATVATLPAPAADGVPTTSGGFSTDDVLSVLLVKGYATPEGAIDHANPRLCGS